MSASAEVRKSNSLSCLEGKSVRFSFIIEVMPKHQSFEPLSYVLRELKKSLRIHDHNYEDDCVDFIE